jgi:ribosomal subunit interface protein
VDVVVIGCRQVVPDEVQHLAKAKVARLGRFAPVLDRAEIRFTDGTDDVGRAAKVCEVIMSGHGHGARAKAAAKDAMVSVDLVVAKLEHQVERLQGKLLARSHPRRSRVVARV